MKSAMSCSIVALLLIDFLGSASACPVAISAVGVPAVTTPVVVEQAPVVVESVPVVTTLSAPPVTVLATPTVVKEIVKVKARRASARRIRVSSCK
jgi:hypothetical protein